jgi:uncharacterized protein (TIGR03435 family)
LLAERFKLAVHTETRQQPVYELVTSRGTSVGPGLHPASGDCTARRAAAQAGEQIAPLLPPGPGGCGVSIRLGRIAVGGAPMARLAGALSALTPRLVLDRTGLPGEWDFELTFTPDPAALQLPAGTPLPPPAADADPAAPTLFTALEDQLGLKLQPARGPVDMLVVDHVEQPTEN